jgi:hypothetical protein
MMITGGEQQQDDGNGVDMLVIAIMLLLLLCCACLPMACAVSRPSGPWLRSGLSRYLRQFRVLCWRKRRFARNLAGYVGGSRHLYSSTTLRYVAYCDKILY